MQINRLISFPPLFAQAVVPFKLSIGLPGKDVFFAPFTSGSAPLLASASRARVHLAGETVLFTRIALNDGTEFPHALALRPDASLGTAIVAEPLDPRTGRASLDGQPVDLFLRPVFKAVNEGVGDLLVFVLPGRGADGQWPDAGVLLAVVDELEAEGDEDGALTVQIALNQPRIFPGSPPSPMLVGKQFGLPFSVQLQTLDTQSQQGTQWQLHPDFQSSADFTCELGADTIPSFQLDLRELSRPFVDRWGQAGDTPIPYQVSVISVPPEAGGGDWPLRLIEASRLEARAYYAGYPRQRFPQGLGDYVIARRPGTGTLRIQTPLLFGTGLAAAEPRDVPVQVDPVQLILQVTSHDLVDGAILLEDRWRPDDGVLVAGFEVKVNVPVAATLAGQSSLVFDSEGRPAYISAESNDTELLLDVVLDQPPPPQQQPSLFDSFGDNVRRSFRIRATIDKPSVARFWLPPDVIGEDGHAEYIGNFRDVIRAVGPGDASLKVELIGIPEPLPPECLEYGMPPAQTFPIHVPAPLVSDLLTWRDPYFTGANELVFSQGQRDVIFARGTITGHVQNHREQSQAERITVLLERADGQIQRYILRPGMLVDWVGDTFATDALAFDGDLELSIDGLAWSATSGVNTITLSAWKPINQVVGQGESNDVGLLNAVLPAQPGLAFEQQPGDGTHVVRRTQPAALWSMELATHAELLDVPPSGSGVTLDSDSQLAYDRRDKRTAQPMLSRDLGRHRIVARAYNDFGWTASQVIDLFAEEPRVSVDLSVPAGYAGKYRSPNRVGHSVQRVTAEVTIRYALTFQAEGPNLDTSQNIDAPFQDRLVTLDLPTPPAELVVGNNTFSFTGENEFADTTRQETIRRRDDVYDCDQVFVSLECLSANRYIRADMVLDDVVIDHAEQTSGVSWTLGPFVESASPLGFDRIEFTVLEVDDDGDLHYSSSSLLAALQTTGLVGPDYEDLLGVMRLPDSRVLDDADNIPYGSNRWLRVVVEDSSGGDIPVEFVPP
jgi:hypothetical protein